jgi:EmrB/QacA subfamily drug resistance transporter
MPEGDIAAATAQRSEAPAPIAADPKFRMILAGVMTVMGLAVMDSNIVNTSLPRITTELGGGSRLTWVVTAFMLTSTIATPLYGKLSDMYGRRRLMLISIVIFLAGSALCGMAHSMWQLIGFRALQGLGAGGLVPIAQAIVGDVVAPRDRGRYQGLFTSVFATASLAGPLVGGALTTFVSWRWVFYVNLPLGSVALFLIMSSLPASTNTHRRAIDYAGAALLTVATTALLLVFSLGASSPRLAATLALVVLAIGGFRVFVWRERHAAEPILDLALFRRRTFTVGVGATAAMAFAMMAALVLLPLYLQLVLGRSPFQAAMIVTPQVVGMILSSFLGGRAVTVTGKIKPFLMAGVLLEAVALWGLFAGAALSLPGWSFSIAAFALGLGMGMGMPNATVVVQNSVGPEEMGAATGALGFIRSLGGAAGVALSGGVVTLVLFRVVNGEHLGLGTRDVVNEGLRAAARLTGTQRAGFVGAYRQAIEASLFICGLVMSGAFALVSSLPNETLRARA